MTTRTIVVLLVALALASFHLAEAQQQKKVYRVGVLSGQFSGPSRDFEAFRQGLRDLGYIEGKNLIIEYRYANGRYDRLSELASELVRLKVDVITTSGTATAVAAKKATSTIPIVMASSTDPVGRGLIASLARPGGNVTGLTSISGELGGKMLELLKEIIPTLSRVAIALPGSPADERFIKETELPARRLGIQLIPVIIREPQDFESAFRSVAKERANALYLRLSPSTPLAHRKQFMQLAAKRNVPAVSATRADTEAGGLISLGRDPTGSYRRVAVYVDKILKGASPSELPVEAPTKFALVINLKTAKQIGLTIPPNVLARADKVIKDRYS